MKNKLFFFGIVVSIFLYSCKGMYDNIEEYAGESVYPAKYDTIVGHIGFERVEIDLMKAGRIPSSKLKLGKAQKTVVEYDNKRIVIDSLVSWVNVTGLTLPKLYRFKVYTIDEYGNKSVPQEIGLIPYTNEDLKSIAVQEPRVLASPGAAVLDWPGAISSILLEYHGLDFSYVDKDGEKLEGERNLTPRIFLGNLTPGERVVVNIDYEIVPKVNNKLILDTVTLSQPLTINMPTENTVFVPALPDVLRKNGINTFTAAAVKDVSKLTFPINAFTLQDIFYFPNLEELDLTGGDLFELTSVDYNRNGIRKTIGGGQVPLFARRVGDMPAANVQFLKDLLDLGVLKKVKYVRNSLGIDEELAPYIGSGAVEIVTPPQEEYIPLSMFIDGVIQATNWRMELQSPAINPPSAEGLRNVIRAVPRDRSSGFVFMLPSDYEFNTKQYKKLKFKVYGPNKSALTGQYANFRRIWPRFMNYLWAFNTESPFGQQLFNTDKEAYSIPDANLQKWIEMEVDLTPIMNLHSRVLVINVGGEPSMTFNSPQDIVYYFADFRFVR